MKFDIFPNTEKIDTNKILNIKFGIDPTSDKLHLGHLIPLLIVKRMLDKGHHVDIVLGTFTAQLGDPSGKDTMRPILSPEETEKNAQSITEQICKIFGPEADNFSIHKNGDWFNKMSAVEMIDILSKFTTTQLLSRDSFQRRIENNDAIGMHELIVPLLQGFDSVKLETDIEIGGNDQLFNFKMTRDLQRVFNKNPEICFLAPIINGTDGRKMSKTFGNCIFINDLPNDVFGKVMSISDDTMKEWLPIFFDDSFIGLEGASLMHMKMQLAFEITKEIHSAIDGEQAVNYFKDVIQNKNLPTDMLEIQLTSDGIEIVDIIKQLRNCSKNEALRLLKSGAVSKNNGEKVMESSKLFDACIVKVGKRDFAKLI